MTDCCCGNPEGTNKECERCRLIAEIARLKTVRNTTQKTDWHGLEIPAGETSETVIKWWEVDPHPTRKGYILRVRSRQRMLEFVGDNLDLLLEQDNVETDGCTITFRVVEGTIEQYEEDVYED